jgi:hypothetical protein
MDKFTRFLYTLLLALILGEILFFIGWMIRDNRNYNLATMPVQCHFE